MIESLKRKRTKRIYVVCGICILLIITGTNSENQKPKQQQGGGEEEGTSIVQNEFLVQFRQHIELSEHQEILNQFLNEINATIIPRVNSATQHFSKSDFALVRVENSKLDFTQVEKALFKYTAENSYLILRLIQQRR